MKRNEWEKLIRPEIRRVIVKNFLEIRNDMNNSLFETFDEKYLPKIIEEVHKEYLKDR